MVDVVDVEVVVDVVLVEVEVGVKVVLVEVEMVDDKVVLVDVEVVGVQEGMSSLVKGSPQSLDEGVR